MDCVKKERKGENELIFDGAIKLRTKAWNHRNLDINLVNTKGSSYTARNVIKKILYFFQVH